MHLVSLQAPIGHAELAADRLWSAGARAVEEIDGCDDRVELRTTLGTDEGIARRRIGVLPTGWTLRFIEVDEQPADTWREFARPIEVNERVSIRPAWYESEHRPNVLDVAIEPGSSFGLGDHPTTRLSAAAVDTLVRAGDLVADIGCGSGVLAVIAALRGACEVVATDIADAAREATIDNAERNGVAAAIRASTMPAARITGTFDLVIANILAPTLIELAPDLRRLTRHRGHLVISGVLTNGHDHVIDALAPMEVVDRHDLEGWSAVTLIHPRGAARP